jgi:hypothetical protein
LALSVNKHRVFFNVVSIVVLIKAAIGIVRILAGVEKPSTVAASMHPVTSEIWPDLKFVSFGMSRAKGDIQIP